MTPTEVTEILRHLDGWPVQHCSSKKIKEAIDAAVEMIARLEGAEASAEWHKRRWMALQMHQTKMREPERIIVCDILANGELMHPTVAGNRYSVMEESK